MWGRFKPVLGLPCSVFPGTERDARTPSPATARDKKERTFYEAKPKGGAAVKQASGPTHAAMEADLSRID
ncbi:MAG: hypothetical protein EBS86_06940 [Crocinitomicaceae bacterium]|nr:hypothetical protein [Crocinitomicaceae bacterium]